LGIARSIRSDDHLINPGINDGLNLDEPGLYMTTRISNSRTIRIVILGKVGISRRSRGGSALSWPTEKISNWFESGIK